MSTTIPTSAPVPPLQPIAQLFERNLNIRHVYGEPIRQGEITVIPVAKVAMGFGAGMGRRPPRWQRGRGPTESEQGDVSAGAGGRVEPQGGGGGARMTPVGALEISSRGTRFIHYGQIQQLVGAMAIGLGAGLLLARRRH